MTARPSGFFLPRPSGQRFCLFHPPQGGTPRGRILFFHPFAEELNTSRRVVAIQARALAQAGYAVLQFDMLGCGDSSGDFSDARWPAWLEDAAAANAWLAEQAAGPCWFWGLRAGTLLAVEALLTAPEPVNLLFWQATPSGQQVLQQFLRLQLAGQWLSKSPAQHSMPPAQALLDQGESVEVAGYTLHPELTSRLARARLRPPAGAVPGRLVWLDSSTQATPELGLAAEMSLQKWREAGWKAQAQAVHAPGFWQTASTDEAPALMSATTTALQQAHAR